MRQQQDLRLKELTEELERRTNDLDEVKAAYRDALKVRGCLGMATAGGTGPIL